MNIIDILTEMCAPDSRDPFRLLEENLRQGLRLFWQIAGNVLEGSGIALADVSGDALALPFNFFSALFLYSYFRAGIPAGRRVLYAAVNQCLRGMVTGCDNILDNEYKKTLDTDLPEQSHKFRSIIDIMVSDRVLFNLLADDCIRNGRPIGLAQKGCIASLTALSRSGVQEASEETGIQTRPTPEEVISKIHHDKTGVLFECVWAVPDVMEPARNPATADLRRSLYDIGLGCQILDDMADLTSDIANHRHNVVASAVYHGDDERARKMLLECPSFESSQAFFSEFPRFSRDAQARARSFLDSGFGRLFREDHRFMKEPAMAFLARRIGVEALLSPGEQRVFP